MKKYMIPSLQVYRFITECIVASSAQAVDTYMEHHNITQSAEVDWNSPKMKEVRQVISFD